MNICPNAYYNYLKNKKHAYRQEKAEIQRKIVEIYHRENGVPGYRMMNDYLKGIGSIRSDLTIHHFMNELGLRSITRRKKPNYVKGIILHSDQGRQFTAKEFNKFCDKNYVQQSMSKAGCPYDNAVMERFYNTLKHEFYYLYKFDSNDILDQKLYEFVYGKYNHVRPHRANGGLTPYAARCRAA